MADNDDWRVTISLPDPAHVDQVRDSFSVRGAQEDIRRRLAGNVAVGSGDSQIFLYAGTEIAAAEAERIARDTLADRGVQARFEVHRWHPIEEEWEDPDVALPQTEAGREAEHQRLLDAETAESVTAGIASWEARAELPSHREAVELAARLRSEGRAVVRRWRFLVIFANNEDEARELAEQIRREAPPDAMVRAQAARPGLPFTVF